MNLLKALCCLLILFSAVFTANFDINSTSTCTQSNENGFCTKWEQKGSVIQRDQGCFAAQTQVYILDHGAVVSKRLDQLSIGESILSLVEGKQKFSEVKGWLHKNSTKITEFLEIVTDQGDTFLVTESHNIALKDGSYIFAADALGKRLFNGNQVLQINKRIQQGLYSPLTVSGNFFIKTSQQKKTLVHCYAEITNPEFYEPFVNSIFSLWELINGNQSNEEMHPAAKWMRSTFSFLISKKQ